MANAPNYNYTNKFQLPVAQQECGFVERRGTKSALKASRLLFLLASKGKNKNNELLMDVLFERFFQSN
jgi:hypothetical protein